MAIDPFPGGKRCRPHGLYDNLVDQNLGQAYRVVRYVYDNWDVLQLNYALLVQLPPAVWTFDPTDYATAAQGLKADSAVQPIQVSAVGFSGQYADLFNKPVLGTASARDTGYFATAQQGQLAENAIPASQKGTANGVAPLGSDAKIPALFMPSYVDDVLEFASLSNFPASGEAGKIYVAIDTNLVYRWSGVTYIEISPSPGSTDSVPEGAVNRYFTDARVLTVATPAAIGAATTAQGAKADTAIQSAALNAGLALKANVAGAWTNIPWSAFYTDFGGVFGTAAYRNNNGIIEFRGVAKGVSLTGANGVIAFTLPVGARPASQRIVFCGGEGVEAGGNKNLIRIDIQTDGSAVVSGAFTATNYLSLEGVSFSL